MQDVFDFRNRLIDEYSAFSRSFSTIAAPDLAAKVDDEYSRGRYWPEPLIQINPNYKRSGSVQKLVKEGSLHAACTALFQTGKVEGKPADLHLYVHQMQAIAKAQERRSYVVTTGTGSGKSLSFFIPIIDRILKAKQADPAPRTRAIVIYPMNALANSQLEELDKFLHGYAQGQEPFTVKRYTGQESGEERKAIADTPPDILLTNFMMLELILTRYEDIDRRVVDHCRGLEFLVLDELHTYRGRQGADVAMLVRRLRERMQADQLVCIGTSATMSSSERQDDRNQTVAEVASLLFGTPITALDVIGETLERVTDKSRDVAAVKPQLLAALSKSTHAWSSFDEFRGDPLAIWVELNLGIDLPADQPPRRAKPITVESAAERLASDAGCSVELAREGLRRFLVAAHEVRTPEGRAPFAFKLHQFISGPGKVLATLEPTGKRHITLDAQRFAPGRQTEGTQLYPVHFCRDCGQEYHPVWRSGKGAPRFDPREIDDISSDDDDAARYGFLCPLRPGMAYTSWEDVPDSWLDLSKNEPKLKSTYKNAVPESVTVTPQGATGSGETYWFIPGKFRFCLSCGLTHEAYGKDKNRLASLSGEGRSSATTMLTLSAVRQLFELGDPEPDQPDPRKLLGWKVDERQGRLTNTRLDTMLYHYVSMRTMNDVKLDHVFEEFKQWWLAGKKDVDQELARLKQAAAVFRAMVNPDRSTRLGRFAHNLRVLDSTTVTPVVLYLAERLGSDSDAFFACLTVIESYLVRRAVCGRSTKAYNRVFPGLLKRLSEADAPTAALLAAHLQSLSGGETQDWPDDATFRKAWLELNTYKALRTAKTKMLLEALELGSRNDVHHESAQLPSAALHVEHVLPVAWETHWPSPGDENAVLLRNHLLHNIGNLTLLTAKLNPSLSNSGFGVKRPEITKSLLALNAHFQGPDFAVQEPVWDETRIRERAQTLFAVAARIWPFGAPNSAKA